MNHNHGRLFLFSVLIMFIVIFLPMKMGVASQLMHPEDADLRDTDCDSPGDTCWETGFHETGIQGYVNAMAQDPNGNIYVGGWIISAGGLPVNNLAMWDGSTWHDVGGGVTHTTYSPEIYTLAVDASGNLYAGGSFDHAGTVAVSNLAKWNGSTWASVGGGVDGSVLAIALLSDRLYVGGYFSSVNGGSIPAGNFAYLDLNSGSWMPYSIGLEYEYVKAMAFEPESESWFVGGDFSSAGGVPAYGIARLDNLGNWHAVGGGLLNYGGKVNSLLRVARAGVGYDLYVGGEFSQVGGSVDAYNIAVWDGSTWNALNYGTDYPVKAILPTASGDLIVAGEFTSVGEAPATAVNHIARWSSGSWSALGTGLGQETYNEVNALLLSGTDVLAGGDFDEAGNLAVNNLARWSTSWGSFDGGLGTNNSISLLMADGSDVYAAGNITHFGSLQAVGLAKFSEDAWINHGSPASGFVRSLVKTSPTSLIAGGAFSTIGGISAANLASWNGSAWQEFAGGTNAPVNALVQAVDGKLYVGGEFTIVGTANPASYIAVYYEGTWHTLASGLDGKVLVLALAPDGNLYAGGEFSYAGSLYVNHIARWDGSSWHALGGGLDHKYIQAITFDQENRLVAGGYFSYAGDVLANGVALWNGYEWSALGSGMNDGVSALSVDDNGYLYAGGDFSQANGIPASHIARWDGFAWSSLGSGTDDNVFALAIPTGNRLMVGGVFKEAGGNAASYISAYTFPPPVSAPTPQISSVTPLSAPMGGDSFWLTVNGSSFSSRSIVRWNEDTMVTTYVNGNQLRALVPSAWIADEGSADVTVFTPAPSGGGVSTGSVEIEILDDVDTTAPTVLSSLRLNPSPTNFVSVDFTVTFSEAVTGVAVSDFSLTTIGVTGASVTGVSGSGSVYIVTVNTGSENGSLRLDVPVSASITDIAGNPLGSLPFSSGEVYTISKGFIPIFLPLIVR